VNSAHACQDAMVAQNNMSGHLCVVAHDTIVSNDAIMRDMTVGHNQTVVAYFGCPFVLASTVDGNKFSNGSVVANDYSSIFSFKFKILRYSGDYSTRKNATVVSNSGALHDGYVAAYPRAASYLHILMNNTERIYFHIRCKFGVGMYISVWMYHFVCFI
jgi:hypothetical protein